MAKTDEEIKVLFIKHQSPKDWVVKARDNHKLLKALVTGEDFSEMLIEHIEKIEGEARKLARKKYSKDIRSLFSRITRKRTLVFEADGASEDTKLSETQQKQVNEYIQNFKGGKSLMGYIQDSLFKTLLDTDPNGLIFVEYVGTEKIYPTYKSINDIRFYKSNGQQVDYVIFEPKKTPDGIYWRYVDELRDVTMLQAGADGFQVIEERTFTHPFGKVPAFIISPFVQIGTELRLSLINDIIPDAEEYARDKSLLTIYKFLNGSPLHWRYYQDCKVCNGTGKANKTESCGVCSGTGSLGKNDVTDLLELPLPRSTDDIKVAPDLAGFIQPDLETWTKYEETLDKSEERMESVLWTTEYNKDKGKNETATGKFIDQQPIVAQLNSLANIAEWSYNFLYNLVINWALPMVEKDKYTYQYSFGRRFIIESYDSLIEKYTKGCESGINSTILDNYMYQIIVSQFKTNRKLMREMLLKASIEPYIHYSIEQVNTIFGVDEAQKKVLFQQFWQDANKEQTKEQLINKFKEYYEQNRSSITV